MSDDSKPGVSRPMHVHILPEVAPERGTAARAGRVTFEQCAERWQSLDQFFFEWDGSFVWRGFEPSMGSAATVLWQLDGMLYDANQQVQRLELKGECSISAWRQLLQVFDLADVQLAFHLVDSNRQMNRDEVEGYLWDGR